MQHGISKPENDIWYISYNETENVYHYGKVTPEQELTSNQIFFETFDNETDWKNRIKKLNISDELI